MNTSRAIHRNEQDKETQIPKFSWTIYRKSLLKQDGLINEKCYWFQLSHLGLTQHKSDSRGELLLLIFSTLSTMHFYLH